MIVKNGAHRRYGGINWVDSWKRERGVEGEEGKVRKYRKGKGKNKNLVEKEAKEFLCKTFLRSKIWEGDLQLKKKLWKSQ